MQNKSTDYNNKSTGDEEIVNVMSQKKYKRLMMKQYQNSARNIQVNRKLMAEKGGNLG